MSRSSLRSNGVSLAIAVVLALVALPRDRAGADTAFT